MFDVADPAKQGATAVQHLERLAIACKVNATELKAQFDCFATQACHEASSTGCSNKDAWQRVLARVANLRPEARRRYPDDCLRPVLYMWFAFCASTSGVEQAFTKGQRAFTDRQASSSAAFEQSVIRLVTDTTGIDVDDLCKAAQRVWARCCGIARASGSVSRPANFNSGRKRSASGFGEAAFLRKRRGALVASDGVAGDVEVVRAEIHQLHTPLWSAQHERERQFAESKRKERLEQAADEGLLVGQEDDPALHAAASTRRAELLRNAAHRETLTLKHKVMLTGGKLPLQSDLRGHHAYLEDNTWATFAGSWLMHLVSEPSRASVFVVRDPGSDNPRSVLAWAAMLMGAYVISPAVLQGLPGGCSIKYMSALSTRRRVFVSEAFRQHHRRIHLTLEACATAYDRCEWELLPDKAAFDRACARRRAGQPAVRALVVSAERAQGRQDQNPPQLID